MARPRPLVFLALLLGVTGLIFTFPVAAQEEAPTLYLRGPDPASPARNFTLQEPVGATPETIEPDRRGGGLVTWWWETAGLPANWSLAAGSTVRVDVWFDRLTSTVPVPGVPPEVAGAGAIEIEAGLYDTSSEPFATGEAYHQLGPDSGGAVHVQIEIHMDQQREFLAGVSGIFGLLVQIHGVTTAEATPRLLVGAQEAPSAVQIPGFPRGAFEAWEAEEMEARACREKILQNLECVEAPNNESASSSTPVASWPILLMTLALVTLLRTGRARSGKGRSRCRGRSSRTGASPDPSA